jgi:hypothetical protein
LLRSRNALLTSYLGRVFAEDLQPGEDPAPGVPHSDRHHALSAFLRWESGLATPGDEQRLREAAVVEARAAAALAGAVEVLAAHGIDSLVLKGAAYSYTAYPASYLRARHDDDLWVRHADFERACAVLIDAGYSPQVAITASEITRQRHFERRIGSFVHQVDLHWWPVNPSAFDTLPDFDCCFRDSVVLREVGPNVRAPGRVHALVLACAHRVAHHTPTEDAMWLCDVHFLAGTLDGGDWTAFDACARAAAVAKICALELTRARDALGTRLPDTLVADLRLVEGEASAKYVEPLGLLRNLWLEAVSRNSWRARLRLLRSHVMPPPSYVKARYGYDGVALLPFLYAHRAISGLARWTAELLVRASR